MNGWQVFFWTGMGLLCCVGLVQVFSWILLWWRGKDIPVYQVIPIGGKGKNPGDQMALALACVQWESNPSGRICLLYDVGLQEEQAQACERLARASGIRMIRSTMELEQLLTAAKK